LTVLRAPTYILWKAAILFTEFSWIFIFLTSLLIIWGIWIVPYKTVGSVIGIVTLLLFISPILRSYFVSKNIKQNMENSFQKISSKINFPDKNPFEINALFSSIKKITPQNFTYISYPEISLTLDFYSAKESKKQPCIIVVHGGSWSAGDNKQLPELNYYLAQKGFHVAAINYRLAPKFQSPAPIEDIKNALIFLRENSKKLNIDTTQFVLLGRSAGAQIALLAAYTLEDISIKGVIDFYGPADMVWGYSLPANPLVMDSRKVMEDYLGGKYETVSQNYFQSSPVEFVSKNSPPTLIIHGEKDVLVAYEHSHRLEKKLLENHINYYWLKLPWATHGFDYNIYGPSGQLSTFEVETFLNTITKK